MGYRRNGVVCCAVIHPIIHIPTVKFSTRILIVIMPLLSVSCDSDMEEVSFNSEGYPSPIHLAIVEDTPHTRSIVNSINDISSVLWESMKWRKVELPVHFPGQLPLY